MLSKGLKWGDSSGSLHRLLEFHRTHHFLSQQICAKIVTMGFFAGPYTSAKVSHWICLSKQVSQAPASCSLQSVWFACAMVTNDENAITPRTPHLICSLCFSNKDWPTKTSFQRDHDKTKTPWLCNPMSLQISLHNWSLTLWDFLNVHCTRLLCTSKMWNSLLVWYLEQCNLKDNL